MGRAALAPLLLLAGCVAVGFGRKVDDRELLLRDQVKAYYARVSAAFAAGNEQALAALFDPAIVKPMTRERIEAWGRDFFAAHGPAAFRAEKIEIESIGYVEAVVRLTYRVETRDGKGSFGGVERDHLVRRKGRWFVDSWEKEEP